jgi:hypothetical protein
MFGFAGGQNARHHYGALMAKMIVVKSVRRHAVGQSGVCRRSAQVGLSEDAAVALGTLASHPAGGELSAFFAAAGEHDAEGIDKCFAHSRQKLRRPVAQSKRRDESSDVFGHRHEMRTSLSLLELFDEAFADNFFHH